MPEGGRSPLSDADRHARNRGCPAGGTTSNVQLCGREKNWGAQASRLSALASSPKPSDQHRFPFLSDPSRRVHCLGSTRHRRAMCPAGRLPRQARTPVLPIPVRPGRDTVRTQKLRALCKLFQCGLPKEQRSRAVRSQLNVKRWTLNVGSSARHRRRHSRFTSHRSLIPWPPSPAPLSISPRVPPPSRPSVPSTTLRDIRPRGWRR